PARPAPTTARRAPAASATAAGGLAGVGGAVGGRPPDRSCGTSPAWRLGGIAEPIGDYIERQHFVVAWPLPDHRETAAIHQHLGHQRPRVVGGAHHRTVGARYGKRDKIAFLQPRQPIAAVERVGALANRPDDVGRLKADASRRFANRYDPVLD